MTEDLKEFDKLIKKKKISDVDEMLEESKKLTKNIPQLKERYEKVVVARGNVLEASIKVEMAFDELITKTGGEDLVMNPDKKEFHLITGVKKENELNIKILEEEIKQLRAEKQIYAGTGIIMKENLVKLSNLAKDFEDDGNIDAGEILTLAMKKIAEYSYYAEGSGTSGFSAPQMEVNRLLSTLPENNLIDLLAQLFSTKPGLMDKVHQRMNY